MRFSTVCTKNKAKQKKYMANWKIFCSFGKDLLKNICWINLLIFKWWNKLISLLSNIKLCLCQTNLIIYRSNECWLHMDILTCSVIGVYCATALLRSGKICDAGKSRNSFVDALNFQLNVTLYGLASSSHKILIISWRPPLYTVFWPGRHTGATKQCQNDTEIKKKWEKEYLNNFNVLNVDACKYSGRYTVDSVTTLFCCCCMHYVGKHAFSLYIFSAKKQK